MNEQSSIEATTGGPVDYTRRNLLVVDAHSSAFQIFGAGGQRPIYRLGTTRFRRDFFTQPTEDGRFHPGNYEFFLTHAGPMIISVDPKSLPIQEASKYFANGSVIEAINTVAGGLAITYNKPDGNLKTRRSETKTLPSTDEDFGRIDVGVMMINFADTQMLEIIAKAIEEEEELAEAEASARQGFESAVDKFYTALSQPSPRTDK